MIVKHNGIELWYRPTSPVQQDNIENFKFLMDDYPDAKWRVENPSAPWHVKATFQDTTISFWPHKARAAIEGTPSVVGWSAIREMLMEDHTLPVVIDEE
jgi:uncharacterized membrane protein